MLIYAESLLVVVLEMLCCKIFFDTFAEKREDNSTFKNYGIFVGLIFSVYVIARFLSNYIFLKVALISAVIALWMVLCLKMSLGKSIILAAIFEGMLLVIDSFTYLICMTIFDDMLEIDMNYHIQGSSIVILGKVVLFFMVLLLRKKIGRDSTIVMLDAEWLRFIFFPIFTICAISVLIVAMENVDNPKQEAVFFVISFGLAGMNIVMFYLVNDILKREMKLRESQLYELEVKNQTSMYRAISENFTKQRKKTHEYKNQILCIESLIRKQAYNELVEYVSGLSGHLSKELDYISTGHVIVDAILNAKYHEMLEQNILFVFKINDLSGINISDEDTVIILSNLLNNAIEACEKCQDKKIVKLKFIQEEDSIIISVKNTCNNGSENHRNKRGTSKTENAEEHGFGITNIKEAVQRYGGAYSIKEGEKEYYFSIFIPCLKE